MERQLMAELVAWKESRKRKPLLLQGARQVGKTYLLQEFGATYFENVFYLNFEDPGLHRIFEGGPVDTEAIIFLIEAHHNRSVNRKADLLILDEIQDAPNAITALKYFCENHPELAVCCAGSHIGIEGAIDAFPVGKVNFLTLYPMSFDEYLLAANTRLREALHKGIETLDLSEAVHEMLWVHQQDYMFVGGMPEAVDDFLNCEGDRFEALTCARMRHEELLTSYEKDFGKYSGPVNAQRIADVFRNIPIQVQQVVDGSVRRYQFTHVLPGRSKYIQLRGPIDWLVHSGLALKSHIASQPISPLRAYTKENMFKLFFFDIGLMCALLDVTPKSIMGQTMGSFKGFLAEAFTAQQLISGNVVRSLISWSKGQSEIEFIIPYDGMIIPLEVKSGVRTRAKSLRIYKERYAPALAVKLSANNLRLEERHLNAPIYMAGYLSQVIASALA